MGDCKFEVFCAKDERETTCGTFCLCECPNHFELICVDDVLLRIGGFLDRKLCDEPTPFVHEYMPLPVSRTCYVFERC